MGSSRRNNTPAGDAGASEPVPTEAQIQQFVNGEATGCDVLGALYDYVLDEPVPQRLLDLLRK